MAQKTLVVVIDDLTGETLPKEQGQTVRFAVDGQDYEIDLTTENAAELRSAFQRYIDAGRQVGRHAPTGRSGGGGVQPRQEGAVRRPRDTAVVRAWARAHGHEVSDRGRIPTKILEAYDAVN